LNGEIGATSQSNGAVASIGKGKPEFAYFCVDLFDLGFLGPEGRILGGCSFDAHHSEVFRIHPNSAAVEKFVFGSRLDGENVAWTRRQSLDPDHSEAVVGVVEGYASLILLAECFLLTLQ
jgi:hypothetical protein